MILILREPLQQIKIKQKELVLKNSRGKPESILKKATMNK